MKKFKVFTAGILAYFMLISLVPSSLLESIAKASENDYVTFVKSDYYLKGDAQYKDEYLIAYGKTRDGDTDISIVKNGQENLLKQVTGYTLVQVFSNGTGEEVGIVYGKFEDDNYVEKFEKFNFNTREFQEITKEEFEKFKPIYNYNTYENIYDKDEINRYLNKINDKYNLNLNIREDMEYSEESGVWEAKDFNYIIANIWYETKYKDFKFINYYDSIHGIRYIGVIYKDYVYVKEATEYENLDYEILDNNNLYIWETISENKYNLIKIKDGQEISNGEITLEDDVFNDLSEGDSKIYINGYDSLYVYELVDNIYKLTNKIDIVESSYNRMDKLILEKADNQIYLSQVNDGIIYRIIELTDEVNSIKSRYYTYCNIKKINEDIEIITDGGFILLQKKTEETPVEPEQPSNPDKGDTVVNPPVGDNNNVNEDEDSNQAQDTTLDIEVPTLNADEVNEIPVVSSNTNNFNIILKDVEALKNGEGSLKLALNNVTLNLPFSVVDSNLIDANDTVSVKLDIIKDSEITKDLKAINKVFDFNLVVNKENEGVDIHNFKDGVAEITVTLSDAELQGLNKDKLKVYYYNEETKKFEVMETKVEGNNVTFKTSHFSKYVIAEEIVDNTVVSTPDKENDTVTIKPDQETNSNTSNSNTSTTTDSQGSKTETGKGTLPNTGAVVSSSVILVLALGLVVGGTVFFRKKKEA